MSPIAPAREPTFGSNLLSSLIMARIRRGDKPADAAPVRISSTYDMGYQSSAGSSPEESVGDV
jgi:hypothetical protein